MYGRQPRIQGLLLAAGLILALGSAGLFLARYRVYAVPSGSMIPLISPGDRIVVDSWSQDAARGDVVLVDGETRLVKRVAAVGGDTVACCTADARVTVGGAAVAQPSAAGNAPFTVRVAPGRLFLLGDNPGISADSRVAAMTADSSDGDGTVAADTVSGRVTAVLDPGPHLLPDRAAAALQRTSGAALAGLALLAAAGLLALLPRRRASLAGS